MGHRDAGERFDSHVQCLLDAESAYGSEDERSIRNAPAAPDRSTRFGCHRELRRVHTVMNGHQPARGNTVVVDKSLSHAFADADGGARHEGPKPSRPFPSVPPHAYARDMPAEMRFACL